MLSAASLAPPLFSTFSHQRHDFRKKLTEHKMCVLLFLYTLLCETFLILKEFSEILSQISKRLHVNHPLFLLDFSKTWILSTDFEKVKYKISSKSVQWEASCSMQADGQTDMTKLTVAFRNLANAPNNLKKKFCSNWKIATSRAASDCTCRKPSVSRLWH